MTEPAAAEKPKRSRRRRILAVAVGLFVPLLIVEIGVRVFSSRGYVTPAIQKERVLHYVPAVFSRQVFALEDRTAEAWAKAGFYHVNAQGFRGAALVTQPKPPGTIRVLVYGGSSAFDLDAPEGEDWPRRVETLLRARGHANVEVVNAAVPGTNSPDCFGRLFAEGHTYSPDYVLLYDTWNDLKSFSTETPLLRAEAPIREDADPRLNYQGTIDRVLCNLSQLYVRARDRWYTWRLGSGLEQTGPATPRADHLSAAGPRQYELTLRTWCRFARDIGAVPVLVTEARLVSRTNTKDDREKINYDVPHLTHEALCSAFETADRLIRDVGRELSAVVIDPAASMASKPEFFVDHVHTSPQGSAEVARIVAEALEKVVSERR